MENYIANHCSCGLCTSMFYEDIYINCLFYRLIFCDLSLSTYVRHTNSILKTIHDIAKVNPRCLMLYSGPEKKVMAAAAAPEVVGIRLAAHLGRRHAVRQRRCRHTSAQRRRLSERTACRPRKNRRRRRPSPPRNTSSQRHRRARLLLKVGDMLFHRCACLVRLLTSSCHIMTSLAGNYTSLKAELNI